MLIERQGSHNRHGDKDRTDDTNKDKARQDNDHTHWTTQDKTKKKSKTTKHNMAPHKIR
jgi:hypothetical protein